MPGRMENIGTAMMEDGKGSESSLPYVTDDFGSTHCHGEFQTYTRTGRIVNEPPYTFHSPQKSSNRGQSCNILY